MPPRRNTGKDKAASKTSASSPTASTQAAAASSPSSLPHLSTAATATAEPPKSSSPAGSSPTTDDSSTAALPLWLTEGSTQRDKSVLCESVYIYTPDGKHELIKNARVQFVAGRRYGLIGRNGIGKVSRHSTVAICS